jgi:hypothetical protein
MALLAFAGVASGVPSASASRADASTPGSLNIVAGPLVGGSELRDVAFLAAGESWAVGDVLTSTGANQTLIERFDGTRRTLIEHTSGGMWTRGRESQRRDRHDR